MCSDKETEKYNDPWMAVWQQIGSCTLHLESMFTGGLVANDAWSLEALAQQKPKGVDAMSGLRLVVVIPLI